MMLLWLLRCSSLFLLTAAFSPWEPCSSSRRHCLRLSSSTNNEDPPPVFPISTRTALVEKAKELDANLAKGAKVGGYSSVGWSNRLGTVLTPASIPGVYTGDREFMWNNIDVSCRMVVIQLANSKDLWVHSPVGLDEPLKEALDKLGTVKYVVSPNYEHLKFAPQWAAAYPDAHMWGCPGLPERMPEVDFAGEIPTQIRPSSWKAAKNDDDVVLANQVNLDNCWDLEEIQPLHIDVEVSPATGKPFFNEVVFFHTPSQTLITTDLYWNYPQADGIPNSHLASTVQEWELAPSLESIPAGSRAFFFAMNRLYLPIYKNVMVTSKDKFQDIIDFIVRKWKATTLIPAHGDLVRGQEVIQQVLKKQLDLKQ
ncbi:Conserved hypothetical protein [Seminavis robusta]|uniref:Metallo-beta-lactamase domain-containing protein n=1 Tax=Seminavis robusta TaxID=568900 RepID=A0A9N8H6F0_9STRA|nr:Conserved hypothetical protein [Seminavis robusta]|eukprot:Sro98_g050490.1 Conserved hypothetical protein (368) ;mRNA; r:61562-62665